METMANPTPVPQCPNGPISSVSANPVLSQCHQEYSRKNDHLLTKHHNLITTITKMMEKLPKMMEELEQLFNSFATTMSTTPNAQHILA